MILCTDPYTNMGTFIWKNCFLFVRKIVFDQLNIFLQALLSLNVKKHTHFSLRYTVHKCPTVNPQISLILLSSKRNVEEENRSRQRKATALHIEFIKNKY